MKNLQKIAVALLVGIMAIGFSAFTSKKVAVQQYVYLHDPANNQYTLFSENGTLPSTGGCATVINTPDCYISYSTKQGDDFPTSTIPSGGEASGTEGVWEE